MSELKTVWILGAGFSRPLGGPLLSDLLSNVSVNNVRNRYPSFIDDGPSTAVISLYREFRPDGQVNNHGSSKRILWDDAERFLEVMSACADFEQSQSNDARLPCEHYETLCDHIKQNFTAELRGHDSHFHIIDTAARRIVAAECCLFVNSLNRDSERMVPYLNWAESLTKEDTIITFNYDLVLEKCVEWATFGDVEFAFHLPIELPETTDNHVNVYKLHGSVDWIHDSTNMVTRDRSSSDQLRFLRDRNVIPAIAMPGPHKMQFGRRNATPWERACEAIKNATFVNIVGYRLPETDSFAMMKITQALLDNRVPNREFRLILGARTSSDASQRLLKILGACWGKRMECKPLPYFSQDFLTLHVKGAAYN